MERAASTLTTMVLASSAHFSRSSHHCAPKKETRVLIRPGDFRKTIPPSQGWLAFTFI